MADTEDTATLTELLKAHGDVSYDMGTPREYTGHGGWNVDCGCGVFVGALADHDAHVARAVLASSWLLARDERIRADEREKLAGLADRWERSAESIRETTGDYEDGVELLHAAKDLRARLAEVEAR